MYSPISSPYTPFVEERKQAKPKLISKQRQSPFRKPHATISHKPKSALNLTLVGSSKFRNIDFSNQRTSGNGLMQRRKELAASKRAFKSQLSLPGITTKFRNINFGSQQPSKLQFRR